LYGKEHGRCGEMPTGLAALIAHQRDVQVQRENEISLLAAWYAITLSVLTLLFRWPAFADAMVVIGGL
jgi:hypothetical protein